MPGNVFRLGRRVITGLLTALAATGCTTPTSPTPPSPTSPPISAPRCQYQFDSGGCTGGVGLAVQIVGDSSSPGVAGRCWDFYVNDYRCKHPGSPICFGRTPDNQGRVVGGILARFPSSLNNVPFTLIAVPQGTQPSSTNVWRDIVISGCAIETYRLTNPAGL